MKRKHIVILIVALLVVDQISKVLVKTNMSLGESIHVFGNWFQICFVENEGAAFGMSLGGRFGKIALSLFRIVAVCAIGWYLNHLYARKAPTGVLVGVAMILAGALGNIIDSAFYGIIWDYAPFLYGRVVDMLYFPLFTIGNFTFFSPVFNLADSYICVAVFYLIIFNWKYFK